MGWGCLCCAVLASVTSALGVLQLPGPISPLLPGCVSCSLSVCLSVCQLQCLSVCLCVSSACLQELEWVDGMKECSCSCSCHEGSSDLKLKKSKRRSCSHCSSKVSAEPGVPNPPCSDHLGPPRNGVTKGISPRCSGVLLCMGLCPSPISSSLSTAPPCSQ